MHEAEAPKKPRKPHGKPIVRGKAAGGPALVKKTKQPRVYADYRHLNWAQIRQDFENTDVSWLALARNYGIASDATIRKRAAKDGWTKNVEQITANLVAAGMVAAAGDPAEPLFPRLETLAERGLVVTIEGDPVDEAPPQVDEPAPQATEVPPEVDTPPETAAAMKAAAPAGPVEEDALDQAPPPPQPAIVTPEQFAAQVGPIVAQSEAERLAAERAAHSAHKKPKKAKEFQHLPGGEEPEGRGRTSRRTTTAAPPPDEAGEAEAVESTAPHSGAPPEPIPVGDPDEMKMQVAKGLAQLHLQASSGQLLNAKRMSVVGNLLLARILTALADPKSPEGQEAVNALMSVNAEKETMSGLLKAAENLLKTSAALERIALSMDPKPGPNGVLPAGSSQPYGGGPVRSEGEIRKLAQGISIEDLKKLREVSANLAKKRPDERFAAVPAPTPEAAGEAA